MAPSPNWLEYMVKEMSDKGFTPTESEDDEVPGVPIRDASMVPKEYQVFVDTPPVQGESPLDYFLRRRYDLGSEKLYLNLYTSRRTFLVESKTTATLECTRELWGHPKLKETRGLDISYDIWLEIRSPRQIIERNYVIYGNTAAPEIFEIQTSGDMTPDELEDLDLSGNIPASTTKWIMLPDLQPADAKSAIDLCIKLFDESIREDNPNG